MKTIAIAITTFDRPTDVDGMQIIAAYHPSFPLRQHIDDARERMLDATAAALAKARAD